MSTFILVHGAWQGAWCWDRLAPVIRAAGHMVLTPDLPGHGNNRAAAGVITADAYVDTLCGLVLEQQQPVVLVGHSMGGMVVYRLAQKLLVGKKEK